jgi:hypothetical protein
MQYPKKEKNQNWRGFEFPSYHGEILSRQTKPKRYRYAYTHQK